MMLQGWVCDLRGGGMLQGWMGVMLQGVCVCVMLQGVCVCV